MQRVKIPALLIIRQKVVLRSYQNRSSVTIKTDINVVHGNIVVVEFVFVTIYNHSNCVQLLV